VVVAEHLDLAFGLVGFLDAGFDCFGVGGVHDGGDSAFVGYRTDY
jgi:hypothetical protein